jgi:hypothetical protein
VTTHEVEVPTLAASSARALGAYYTPSTASRFLAQWTLRGGVNRVLEPSMGDGAFLDALAAEADVRGIDPTVWGVEVASDTYAATVGRGAIRPALALREDFLRVAPFPVDAVVANPPFVRLRHLPPAERQHAVEVGSGVLGQPMATDASVWLPFVLHATQFLVPGGRMAFVLPFDVTYLRYARPLWRWLGQRFGSLTVVRVRERMFPELLQEVVLLLAEGFGGTTTHVELRAHRHLRDLGHHTPDVVAQVAIADVAAGERPFVEALLSPEARALLHGTLEERTLPARELVRFNPGYVCGDKAFFHPTAELVERHRLPRRSLVPTLTSSRWLRGTGLWTSDAPTSARSSLFLPPNEPHLLTHGEKTYVARGVQDGAANRYKCRIRDPWYVTPGVKAPDVLLPVFSEAPALLVNDARLAASNSLLCGYLRANTAEHLATAWYTSLTLLQLELQVHSLGGGVLVVVPGEAGNLRLPRLVHAPAGHLAKVSTLLAARQPLDAFELGDEPVLQRQLGLTPDQVEVVQAATQELAAWRTAFRAPPGTARASDSAA